MEFLKESLAEKIVGAKDDNKDGGALEHVSHFGLTYEDVIKLSHELMQAKNSTYKDSWRKNGEFLSTFGNVSRKYDRINNIIVEHIENGISLPTGDSSIASGVMDLLVYCGLWLTLVAEKRPEEIASLVDDIHAEIFSVRRMKAKVKSNPTE